MMGKTGKTDADQERAKPRRTYGGVAVVDRRADRRARFLAAGLEVFGTNGYSATSVADICTAASLSRRQFYDEFDDREDLLLAVYDQIQDHARSAVVEALAQAPDDSDPRALAQAAMHAYMQSVASDRRRAAIAFVSIVGVSQRVEQHRLKTRNRWSKYLLAQVRAQGDDLPVHDRATETLIATGFIGALNAIVHQWSVTGPRRPKLDTVAALLADILLAHIYAGGPEA